jgi:hypothetical protein
MALCSGAQQARAGGAATTTTLAVTSGGNAVTTLTWGNAVTLTATVTTGSTPVTPGQVEFCDAAAYCEDIHFLGMAQLTSAGTATIKFVPAIGSHSYKAVFLGTTTCAGSTSIPEPLTVMGIYPSTSSIAQSGSYDNYTLTATVGGTDSVAPTGTVSFLDTSNGNAVLGTASLGAGTGSVSFQSISNPAGNGGGTVVGDFNGDGIPDLAVTAGEAIDVLLGNGDGTFTAGATVPILQGAYGIAVADFNGDGKLDLAVLSNDPSNVTGTVVVLLGNGDGTFSALPNPILLPNSEQGPPSNIVVSDFNMDGIPDLAVLTGNSTVAILLGKGDGTFTAGTQTLTVTSVDYPANSIVVADFNGDGIPDVAVASAGETSDLVGAHGMGTVTVFLGKGDGTFTTTVESGQGSSATFMATGDFNGDGIPDLALASGAFADGGSLTSITILLGIGNGTFSAAPGSPLALGQNWVPDFITVGDFNGDGIPDLAVTGGYPDSSPGSVEVFPGNGDGSFGKVILLGSTDAPGPIGVGDFTGDGIQDLAVPGNTPTVYLGDQKEAATASVSGITVSTGFHQVVASYPGDSSFSASTSYAITLGEAIAPITMTVTPSSSSITLIQPLTVTVTVGVPAGNPTPTGSVALYIANYSPGAVTLSGGSATFNVPAGTLKPGGYTLQAYYTPDAASSTNYASSYASDPLTVTQAQPALALSVSPVSSEFGQSVTLTATLSGFDAQSTNGETIAFFSNGASIGTGTIASGVATLTISTLALGIDSLTASYPGDINNTAAVSSAALEYVGRAGTTAPVVTLAVNSGGSAVTSVAAKTMVTLTASVSSSGVPVAPGTVTFCDIASSATCIGAGELGTAQLTSSGTAAIVVRLGIGTHTLQAIFNGIASVGGGISSASPLVVTGLRASSGYLAVTQSGGNGNGYFVVQPHVHGEDVFGPPHPTGTVQIIDTSEGNTVLTTEPLVTFGQVETSLFTAASQTPATGSKPFSVAEGDFNHDGIPDLVVANSASNTVSVLLGNGDGTYQTQATYATGNGPYSVTVGDFNGDGNLDLAAANLTDNTISVLLGNGDGTFQAQKTYGTGGGPNAVALGDFNGDGILDLAVANQSDATVSILLGNGDGTFETEQPYPTGNGPVSIAVGDYNGDGIPDLAVANNLDGTLSVLLGKGDGTFLTQVPYTAGNKPISVTSGNLNSDTALDLAVANLADGTVSVFMGNGDGTFQSQVTCPVGTNPYAVVANNFAELGPLDLAVANSGANSVTLLVNNGSGVFAGQNYNTGTGPIALAAGDLNGDGLPDLAVVDNSGNAATILLNVAQASALPAPFGFNIAGTHVLKAVYSGDANFSGSTSPGISLTLPSESTTLTLTSNLNPSNYGDSVTLTATLAPYAIEDGSTNGESITFTAGGSSLGIGTLTNGVATLTTSALQVGTNPIQASYPGDNEFNAAASKAFSLTVRPATLTVMGPDVARAYGTANPALTGTVSGAVNGDTFTVTGTTTATPTSPPGGYTVTPSVSGAHVSDYTVTKVNGKLTVTKATPANALTSSANPAYVSSPVTFTASVSSIGGNAPTGTVTFYDGATALGSATLSAGSATNTTSALTAGAHSITVAYSGDANYVTVTSAALTEVIEDFTLAAASGSSSATVSPGGQAVYTLAIDPPTGTTFASAITFGVSGLPSGATGTFDPTSVAAGAGATNVTLTVTVPSSTSSVRPAERPLDTGALPIALGLLLLPFAGRLRRTGRRWKGTAWLVVALAGAALAAGLTGCGGSSSSNTSPPPPQSYTLTITATSGSLSHSTTVNLTVQ